MTAGQASDFDVKKDSAIKPSIRKDGENKTRTKVKASNSRITHLNS
jgi:hypothetical protein